MTDTPVLITARLILRAFETGDLDDYAEMMADAQARQFVGGKPQSHYESWRDMCAVIGHWNLLGYGVFAVVEQASGKIIGRVGPHHAEGGPGIEMGWLIARSHWGKGYAFEAAKLALDWFFQSFPDEQRLISLIDAENTPSQALAAKLGETNTGETFKHWQDGTLDVWELTRHTWASA